MHMFTQCCSASLPSLQMQQWFNIEGERHLLEAESVEDSGDRMEQILNSFTGFLIEANVSLTLLVSVISSVFLHCLNLTPLLPRTEGTMLCLWCRRQSGFSRAGSPIQRQTHSGLLSVPSNRAWRTSCAGQRPAAENCKSWSMCVIFVNRFVKHHDSVI